MPIDHISISVNKDLQKKVVEFYLQALKPLGYELVMEPFPGHTGLGVKPMSDFWISSHDGTPPTVHVAFSAKGERLSGHPHFACIGGNLVD